MFAHYQHQFYAATNRDDRIEALVFAEHHCKGNAQRNLLKKMKRELNK